MKTYGRHHPNRAAKLFAAAKLFKVCRTGVTEGPRAAPEKNRITDIWGFCVMRRRWIIAAVVVCVIALPFVSLRVSTVRAIARIEALQGRTGDFADLTKTIRTRYSTVDSLKGLERARTVMGLDSVTNFSVVRFNGEGLPYYYGYVAYDTNKQQVVRAVVDQLW